MYVYIRSEPGLWTVGFYSPDGEWHPESDHESIEEAAARVAWLNGQMINSEKDAKTVKGEYDEKICKECYSCIHMREVPGDAHIKCVMPDADMVGELHGVKKGWFMYPLLFDPVWKRKRCSNFVPIDKVNHTVSDAVIRDE